MKIAAAILYHGLALLALLAQLVVGTFVLLVLALTAPPDRQLAATILKVIIVVVWVGLFLFGAVHWSRRSWLVVAVPFPTFAAFWVLDAIGDGPVGWYLDWGY